MPPPATATAPAIPPESLCERVMRRMASLKTERGGFEPDWSELSEYFQPRQGRYVLSGQNAGTPNRKPARNNKIVRNTTLTAVRTFQAGMMSGSSSPAAPWFRLTTPDPALAERAAVKAWLYTCETRMREIFAKSNLYNALPGLYGQLGVFATGAMIILEDPRDVVRFYLQPIGSFYLSQSHRQTVDTLYSSFQMTVRQLVQQFGLDNCSSRVQQMAKSSQLEQWIDVIRAIEPNEDRKLGIVGAPGMAIRSVYVERGGDKKKYLSNRGFEESPIIAPRWDLDAEDTYGSSCPGMVALGPARALMVQERRKAQAIDKMVTPPLSAPSSLRNEFIDNTPGGYTYYDEVQGHQGIKSLYDVKPDIQALVADIKETGAEIKEAFFYDLFLAISQMEGVQPRNQWEIAERKSERLLQVGPALERLHGECHTPIIDRTFSIMVRRSRPIWEGVLDGEPLIPPPPPELQKTDLRVEFISLLAQAQRAVGVSSIERLIAFTGNIAQQKADPSVWDKLDTDEAISEMAEMVGTQPKVIRSDDDVAKTRADRAQAQQAQQLAAMAKPLADAGAAAKSLSEADTGDGSALANMVKNATGGARRG